MATRTYRTPKKSNVQNNTYSGNLKLGSTTSTPGKMVMNNTKKEQGYNLTTSYASKSNLTDRGYPNNYSDKGIGMTGSKLNQSSSNGVRSISGGGSSKSNAGGGYDDDYGYDYGYYDDGGGYDSGLDAFSSLLAAYQNNYNDYLEEMRAAARQAYDRGMTSLNDAYNSQMTSLKDNLNSTNGQLLDAYNRSKKSINTDSEASLRQAYINKMLSERNLGQMMSAQGLSGGATETSMANMLNNYGNARNAINTTTNNNLKELEGNYNDSLAQAAQAYNTAVANTNAQKTQQVMALENALAGNEMSALTDYHQLMQQQNRDYLDLLKTAIAHQASYTPTATKANNTVKTANVKQASQPLGNSNYAALQAIANAQQAPGTSGAIISLANPSASNNYLAQILAQLA